MKKRLLTLLLAVAVLSAGCGTAAPEGSSALAKNAKTIVISQFAEFSGLDDCRQGFIQGLAEGGYKEGANLHLEIKNAQGDMAVVNQIANQLAGMNPDLACGITTPSSQALYNTCKPKGIPVVYIAVSDPVAAGFAKNAKENAPGISGTSDALPLAPQLDLIQQLLPDAKRIGVLYSTSEVNSQTQVTILRDLCAERGLTLEAMAISTVQDIPEAMDQLLEKVDVIDNLSDNTVTTSLPLIIAKAEAKGIAVFGSDGRQVETGCAAAMAIDYVALGAQSGRMAARVLDGASIDRQPFEQVGSYKLIYNPEMCERLGIHMPAQLKGRAVKNTGKQ